MSNCKICFQKINDHGIFNTFLKTCICQKCFNELNPKFIHFKISHVPCLALFEYDETIKNMIYTLKGCYDIELAEVFLNRFLLELKIMYFGYVIVPLPSNLDEDERRGFNHVEQVFSYLKLPIYHLLYKKIHFKQSDLSLHQREEIINKIGYEHLELIKGKKVLIVDDISTSGNSLKAAIALIKKGNPKCVKVLVLAKKCRK